MSYAFDNGKELLELCENENITIAEVMIRREMERSEDSREKIVNEMYLNLKVMEKSIRTGLEENQQTMTGLAGNNAEKLYAYAEKANMGQDMARVCAAAMAVTEVNASMGEIVATPTASCGASHEQRKARIYGSGSCERSFCRGRNRNNYCKECFNLRRGGRMSGGDRLWFSYGGSCACGVMRSEARGLP